jgi:hypothetical protein
VRDVALLELNEQYSAYVKACDIERPGKFLKAALLRSPFATSVSRNLGRLARDEGVSQTLVKQIEASIGLTQTKLIEDSNHFLRALESRGQTNNLSSSVRAWHEIVMKQVLSKASRIQQIV